MGTLFADEASGPLLQAAPPGKSWRILVVDDEPEVHTVTRLALRDVVFEGLRLEVISAHSAREARDILAGDRRQRIALMLLDVVMETDDAGLDLVKFVREDLDNRIVRIVLRTGQPGLAPERSVIVTYDINDYKAKTDLTAAKLFTTVIASLRGYRDLVAVERSRRGLEQIVASSASVFKHQDLRNFANAALGQLAALVHADPDAAYFGQPGFAAMEVGTTTEVLAGAGRYESLIGRPAWEVLPADVAERLAAFGPKYGTIKGNGWIAVLAPSGEDRAILHLETPAELDRIEQRLVEVFAGQIGLAFSNIRLNQEVVDTQKSLVFTLSEAIEMRSRETGNHVRRVSKSAALLASLLNMSTEEQLIVEAASPLHDVGKISIPDRILNKPGKLDPGEWEIMKTHAATGAGMLSKWKGPIFAAAAVIAGQHHEKWDGTGYPDGRRSEDIHVYGRIAAVVDVFDALASDRCYKKAWPIEKVVDYIGEQRGLHFDPTLVDLLLGNLAQFVAIRDAYPDTYSAAASAAD